MITDQSRAELFLTQEFGVSDLAQARARLAATEVLLALSPEVADDRLAQLALLTAANILCRLGPYCPNIAVSVPPTVRVAPGVPLLMPGTLLSPALCQFMTIVQRPEDRPVRRYRSAVPEEVFNFAFVIGECDVPAHRTLHGWYERWTGGYDSAPRLSRYRGPNPFGALLAGALGTTALSRLLLGPIADPGSAPKPPPDAAALSAYSYCRPDRPGAESDLPEVIELRPIEPVLLIGGGAVASGAAFALASLASAKGTIDVADDDTLDPTNLERHLVSTWTNVGVPKACHLADVFDAGSLSGLRLRPHTSRYEALDLQPWRTVLACVDRPEPRRRLQFDLPRVVLNAGTVGAEFLVSRHDYGAGPCAECLYPERPASVRSPAETLAAQTGLDVAEVVELRATNAPLSAVQLDRVVLRGALEFPPEALARAGHEGIRALAEAVCTAARVRLGLPVATIGFVAALPGLLLAAELVKEAILDARAAGRPPLIGGRNVFRMDTFGDLSDELEDTRPSRGCRCQDEVMRIAYRCRWEKASRL